MDVEISAGFWVSDSSIVALLIVALIDLLKPLKGSLGTLKGALRGDGVRGPESCTLAVALTWPFDERTLKGTLF